MAAEASPATRALPSADSGAIGSQPCLMAHMKNFSAPAVIEPQPPEPCAQVRILRGRQQLFGLLGRGKTQVAYAKITLNIVNVLTSEVVYSASGAGEYALSTREVVGFGGTSGYDATLNGKVLDLAMREAVNKMVAALDAKQWGAAAGARP